MPPYRIVEMPDGSFAFASTILPGPDAAFAPSKVPRLTAPKKLSALYAYDLFVHNPDRHVNNFLWREVGDALQMYAFDFSRAELVVLHKLDRPLLKAACATRATVRKINRVLPYDVEVMTDTLDRIHGARDSLIEPWIEELPGPWLSPSNRDFIRSWWASGRIDRAVWLSYEVRNGHAL